MYCSSCGTESIQGLNYCNRCGATLNTQILMSPSFSVTKPTLILGGLTALISLFGFIALIASAGELARKGFEHDQVMAMLFAGMFIIFVVDVLLLRQMSRIINASLQAGTNAPAKQVTKIAEPGQTQRKLGAPPLEPVPSVTENTTRTFDPVYRETSR
jgi:hypothetical protein